MNVSWWDPAACAEANRRSLHLAASEHNTVSLRETAKPRVCPMPSPTPRQASADDAPPRGHAVAAVTRALSILDTFGVTDAQLMLAEIARRTGLPKPTALRLARTLAQAGYLVPLEGGAWRLGPAAARLGARYQRAFDLRNLIEPALVRLAQQTGHGTSFFALEAGQRVRLLRVIGKDGFVSPSRVGEPLPLDRGAAGQVILAFSGATGPVHETIRALGYHLTVGEADAAAASIAAPVFGARGEALGALSVAAAAAPAASHELARHAAALVESARRLSATLAATSWLPAGGHALPGRWHP